MAKIKLAGKKKAQPAAPKAMLVPCVIFILSGLLLMTFLFYSMLKKAG